MSSGRAPMPPSRPTTPRVGASPPVLLPREPGTVTVTKSVLPFSPVTVVEVRVTSPTRPPAISRSAETTASPLAAGSSRRSRVCRTWLSMGSFRSVEQVAQVGSGRDLGGLAITGEEAGAGRFALEGEGVPAAAEPGSLSHAEHRSGVLLEELQESQLAGLALVGRGGIGIEVVRVDLERDQLEGPERRGLDDRHVVGGAQRRRRHVGPGGGAEVGGTAEDRSEERRVGEER